MVQVAKVFLAGGGAIFDNLPLLFAVGVAIGLTEGEGVAGLAAVIGYLVLSNVLKTFDVIGADGKPTVHLDMGVLGGIMTGIIASVLFRRFKDIQLPPILPECHHGSLKFLKEEMLKIDPDFADH